MASLIEHLLCVETKLKAASEGQVRKARAHTQARGAKNRNKEWTRKKIDCGSVIDQRIECFVAFMLMFERWRFQNQGVGRGRTIKRRKQSRSPSQRQEKDPRAVLTSTVHLPHRVYFGGGRHSKDRSASDVPKMFHWNMHANWVPSLSNLPWCQSPE